MVSLGFTGRESTCNAGDLGLIPRLGRSSGKERGYPLQYSGLKNSMDCIVHGVTKSWTQLSNFLFKLMLLNCGVGEDSLRVPWTARRSNQSILKEIGPGYSLEGMMLKLKFQYFGHLMRRVDSLEKTLMLGGIGGR